MTGVEFVNQAREYLGVPYYHTGRDRNGLDCLGLLVRVVQDLGLTTWDDRSYGQQIDTSYLRWRLKQFCEYLGADPDLAEPGDVLLFTIKGSPQHLGMATDRGVIHAYQSVGRVVEHSLDATWRRRLAGVFRWRGILD